MWFSRFSILLIILFFNSAHAQNEVLLFDEVGKAVAYIAVDDEMTIYLWDGKPIAYLKEDIKGNMTFMDSMENI